MGDETINYTTIDFAENNTRILCEDEILIIANKAYRIEVNRYLSKKLRDAKKTRLLIRIDNISNKLKIVFNDKNGIIPINNKYRMKYNSKPMVSFLMEKFSINDGTCKKLKLKKITTGDSVYTYDLMK